MRTFTLHQFISFGFSIGDVDLFARFKLATIGRNKQNNTTVTADPNRCGEFLDDRNKYKHR